MDVITYTPIGTIFCLIEISMLQKLGYRGKIVSMFSLLTHEKKNILLFFVSLC